MFVPDYVREATDRMEGAGHEIYLVGGCVRDMLMGKTPNDYDLTTSALPEETAACFSGYHVIETGLKHGTLTVRVQHQSLEITTYRRDGEYDDNRHPVQVSFTRNIRDDLSRRDFTVNAMAYSEKLGLVDEFGGREDLSAGLIRCVGDPDVRFAEDGLRIMRALRFCATLGFKMEEKTAESVHRNRELLRNISAERIREEFFKLICGKGATAVLREFYDVIAVFVPEILPCVGFDQNTRYHHLDVFEHTLAVIDGCDMSDRNLRLAAFFHDIGKPLCYSEDERGGHFYGHDSVSADITDEVMLRLKSDNDTRKKVRRLVSEHMKLIEPTERAVRRFISDHSDDDMERTLALMTADRLACAPDNRDVTRIGEIRRIAATLRAREERISYKTLAVHGDDLIAIGIVGKEIGRCLEYILSKVLDGELANGKEELLRAAKEWKKK